MTGMSDAEYALMPFVFYAGMVLRPVFDRYVFPLLRDLTREF